MAGIREPVVVVKEILDPWEYRTERGKRFIAGLKRKHGVTIEHVRTAFEHLKRSYPAFSNNILLLGVEGTGELGHGKRLVFMPLVDPE